MTVTLHLDPELAATVRARGMDGEHYHLRLGKITRDSLHDGHRF